MTYELATISAAIDKLTMERAGELKIQAQDGDQLGLVMSDAIQQVAHQMTLEGMQYKDAFALAEKGSMSVGRETPESTDLAERAYANRGTPLPDESNADDPAASAPMDIAAPVVHAPLPIPDQVHDGDTAAASTTGIAAPRADVPRDAPGAPAVIRQAVLAPAQPLLRCTVEMRPVLDVFPSIAQDPRAYLFNFKIPFVMWEGGRLHPRIPKKKNYQFNLPDLHAALYALATDTVTNVVGPTGCGKTELVKQIANRVNMPVTLVPMDGQITRNQLIGQRGLASTAQGPQDVWRDGIIARALLEPGILLLDEVDRGVSDVQYAVHSIYTGEGLTLLDDGGRILPMHAFNRVFTTSNTKGRGSDDGLYQATEEMTEATRNRISQWIEMDYQSKDEDIAVLQQEFAKTETAAAIDDFAVEKIADIASQIRESFKGQTMSQPCSMRDQIETAKRYHFFAPMARDEDERKVILADAIRMIMANRASEADKAQIETAITTTVGVNSTAFISATAASPGTPTP